MIESFCLTIFAIVLGAAALVSSFAVFTRPGKRMAQSAKARSAIGAIVAVSGLVLIAGFIGVIYGHFDPNSGQPPAGAQFTLLRRAIGGAVAAFGLLFVAIGIRARKGGTIGSGVALLALGGLLIYPPQLNLYAGS